MSTHKKYPTGKKTSGHIDSAKYVSSDKKHGVLTEKSLNQDFSDLEFVGRLQQTGMLGRDKNGDFVVFIRHPWWVPVRQTDKSISYGASGKQTSEHLMYVLGRKYGKRAEDIALEVTQALKTGNEIPYGALSVGKEHEAIAHDIMTGSIEELDAHEQFEFQAGIHEDALPPFETLQGAFAARIEQLSQRERNHPGLMLMDTSAPLAGSPNDAGMQLNNGEGGAYIRPWSEHLKQYLVLSDPKILSILNVIAKSHGHQDYKSLMRDKGFQVLWPSVACQTSIGMPHISSGKGELTIPLEIAIATADIFNSHLGIVADMLMASSPFVFGVAPMRLRDYRMALRNIFAGALPSPFIKSVNNLQQRWEYGGVHGMLYTLDRLSYQTKRRGHEPHAMIYGSARVRVETKDKNLQLGRVENTIAGSSPSLLDEIAHDTFIYLLSVAALDAVAHGQMPAAFFGRFFPHSSQWRRRKVLTDHFNRQGAQHPQVDGVLQDALGLLTYLRNEYPSLHAMITFVIARICNLQSSPQPSLAAYQKAPIGPISEVMMTMHDKGIRPLEIMKEAYKYQHYVAKEIQPMARSDRFFELLNKRFV
ncbi:MAG TPA: hypothetical protein VLG16_04875 [Candidatus Saccharimonadales bacterium]|nr:hypothetical protein [Candidatus Saccharimonadales bacterium]